MVVLQMYLTDVRKMFIYFYQNMSRLETEKERQQSLKYSIRMYIIVFSLFSIILCTKTLILFVSPDDADGSACHRTVVLGVVTAIDFLSYITSYERQDSSMSECLLLDNVSL